MPATSSARVKLGVYKHHMLAVNTSPQPLRKWPPYLALQPPIFILNRPPQKVIVIRLILASAHPNQRNSSTARQRLRPPIQPPREAIADRVHKRRRVQRLRHHARKRTEHGQHELLTPGGDEARAALERVA